MKTTLYFIPKLFLLFVFFSSAISAQEDFYDVNAIREIQITFDQANWDHLLDSLFEAGDEERLMGDLLINGQTMDSVGIRYKGYSSVNVEYVKNPLNIKLDYVINNQEYLGINKIKLSNVIHDPTFIREVLSFDIARKYLAAPRANWANVYINDTLIGLFVNVESVNKDFADDHFGSTGNSFFKGEPLELEYPFGSNANLQYYNGDTSTYLPYYALESDAGWNDLLDLIDILNNHPENIEQILNVDQTLWMHALNYVLVNLDSYIAYAQNYYLYEDNNGRFNPIPWDLNMSFGSFRFSDGSYGAFTGNVTIEQAKNLDPLGLLELAASPRPLLTQLMLNPSYKRMYLAHIRTIVNENLVSGDYRSKGEVFQELINAAVQNDPNKFYSFQDFVENLTSTVGGSGNMIEYPGISDLMQGRVAYLTNYEGFLGSPEISGIENDPDEPSPGESISLTANISDATSAYIFFRQNETGVFIKQEMFDDGAHNDQQAGDGIWGTEILAGTVLTNYYLYAENETTGTFSPERAANEYYTINSSTVTPDLVINEFMASNTNAVADQDGEYDDWIELYNNSQNEIELEGLFLSDNPSNLIKWPFPDTNIRANGYLIVWADEDGSQEGLHANFKLSASGESIFLVQSSEDVIDFVEYGEQTTDISTGRWPNGSGSFIKMPFTFAAPNMTNAIDDNQSNFSLSIFPNPANSLTTIQIGNQNEGSCVIELRDLNGKLVKVVKLELHDEISNHSFDISGYTSGIYVVRIILSGSVYTQKLIVL